MRRNQNFEKCKVSIFYFFFAFPFSPFLFFLLQWLTFYWACLLASKEASLRRAVFTMEQPGVVAGNFAPSFSLSCFSIFVHITGSIRPITLIWVLLERSFPLVAVEYRWCQFWSKLMTSEVEERPRLITDSYGRHRSQWVKRRSLLRKFKSPKKKMATLTITLVLNVAYKWNLMSCRLVKKKSVYLDRTIFQVTQINFPN